MNDPRPESRISSVEKRTTKIEAQIEELHADNAEEFKALRKEIKALGEHVDEGFRQAHRYVMDEVASKADINSMEMRIDKRFEKVNERFDKLEQEHGELLKQILSKLS